MGSLSASLISSRPAPLPHILTFGAGGEETNRSLGKKQPEQLRPEQVIAKEMNRLLIKLGHQVGLGATMPFLPRNVFVTLVNGRCYQTIKLPVANAYR
jgi:hypothetical protein